MSDEETRSDAAETKGDGSTVDAQDPPTESGSSATNGGESSPGVGASDDSTDASAAQPDSNGGEVSVKEASQQAAFAATVLGDTLPSAVRTALASGGDSAHGQGSHGQGGHGAGGHGHGGGHAAAHDDEHFAHTLPMTILGGVLGALIVLTVLTVAVTSIDLGSQGNFIVAMIIATIKAALVMGYFMHLVWDSKFNALLFLSSFLFVLLFLSMALLDRREYQPGIDGFEVDQKAIAK